MFNEGFSIGRFNKFRYMGPGYPKQKGENTIRIALLGDSFVEGFQVFDRNHFRYFLENELSKKLNKKVEVLNFGRSGFDIGDMYAYNQTFVKEFNPDFSLYFVSNNDLMPQFSDPLRMKVRIEKDSLLIVKGYPEDYIQLFNKTKYLVQYSAIFNMLNNGYKLIKRNEHLPVIFDKFYTVTQSSENENIGYNNDSTFYLPKIATEIVKRFDPSRDIIINRDLYPLPSNLISLINDYSIHCIDMRDTLDYLQANGIDPYYWEATNKKGHWNHKAHIAVGHYVALKLNEIISNPEY
jgi:lysophospholipase L1-like esterase